MSMTVSLNVERFERIKDDISQIEQVFRKLSDDIPHNLSVMKNAQTKTSVDQYTNHEALLRRVESMTVSVQSSAKKISNLMLNIKVFKESCSEIEKSRSSYSSILSRIDDLSPKVLNVKSTLDFHANELNNIWQRFKSLSDSYSSKILRINACLEIEKKVDTVFQLKALLAISPEESRSKKPCKDVLLKAMFEANGKNSEALDSLLICLPVDLLENEHLVAYLVKPYSSKFK